MEIQNCLLEQPVVILAVHLKILRLYLLLQLLHVPTLQSRN